MSLDPGLKKLAQERADLRRRDAAELQEAARALLASAEAIERTWQIPPPCKLCGSRECSH